ncbi:DUF1707 and DUF4870 domain-containing protein [Propioniciclava coleopterorum]|uniref:DUF1707 and DUF4870 domain-containing protein n=1 Tax=Propioniciclava coleopterorum TaxID=2714937 RepID=A0A6G7Y8W9_9ACTN|nr:DUF1707 and DUF4870 domain-containing protein [Propioniciclava coleopterorum]QIK73255.1 DUF1707 and DUF4870 domain-containing protein [Propioniciclava coleopterorum]
MPVDPYASPSLRVGDAERARAEAVLQEAYCTGRLDEVELDQRLGMAMSAQTRRDLSAATAGLPVRPAPLAAFTRPTPTMATRPGATPLGGIAHLSGLFTWIIGPLLCYAVATPGTPARRESAKAFNFQAISGILGVVSMVLASLLLPGSIGGPLVMIAWVTYMILTIVGSARAFSGQPFANPVTRIIRWEALDTSGR